MKYFYYNYEEKPIKTIIITTCIFMITQLLLIPIKVKAETCASSTNYIGYLNPTTNQWYSSTTNNVSVPNGTTRLVIRTDNANIKNNQISWSNTYAYKTYGRDNINPSIEVRYGTSSSFQTIEDRCAKSLSREYSANCGNPELLDCWTTTKITMSCNFTGDNTSANTIQIHINTNSPIVGHNNTNGNFYRSSTCLQISPNSTDQIVNAIEESAISTSSSTQEAAEEVVNAIEEISNKLDVQEASNINGPTSSQENGMNQLETREGNLLSHSNASDINSLNITINQNTGSFIWSTITNFIQQNMLVYGFIITILTIGYLKLVLGR